jgi:predicted amidohydrolase YtcJ
MLADFVVLSQDITSVPRERIGDTVVLETVAGGKSAYKAP